MDDMHSVDTAGSAASRAAPNPTDHIHQKNGSGDHPPGLWLRGAPTTTAGTITHQAVTSTIKRPSFQFYPADWRKDMALQSCSVAARGLWIEMLCIAHECTPYGHLTVNGKPMSPAQIGRHTGLSEREASKLLTELAEAGVSSVSEEGAIYCRRMVRDEDIRNQRAEAGIAGAKHGFKGAEYASKGGRPSKGRGVSKPPSEPPPSSSSSCSSSKHSPSPPDSVSEECSLFEQFWRAYPRRIGRSAALNAFMKHQPDAALVKQMVAAIEQQGLPEKCARGEDRYVPFPANWLEAGRWMDEVPGSSTEQDQPAWALAAGFATRYDAENAGCTELNAYQFRSGERLEDA